MGLPARISYHILLNSLPDISLSAITVYLCLHLQPVLGVRDALPHLLTCSVPTLLYCSLSVPAQAVPGDSLASLYSASAFLHNLGQIPAWPALIRPWWSRLEQADRVTQSEVGDRRGRPREDSASCRYMTEF